VGVGGCTPSGVPTASAMPFATLLISWSVYGSDVTETCGSPFA
jgi:hypothetical protein